MNVLSVRARQRWELHPWTVLNATGLSVSEAAVLMHRNFTPISIFFKAHYINFTFFLSPFPLPSGPFADVLTTGGLPELVHVQKWLTPLANFS